VEEVPLAGGWVTVGTVVRVGDTVRRPMRPNSTFAHGLLLRLERAGFDGAPRFLGVDERGREILRFLPGRLLRDFHTAAAGVVHGDPGQWNMLWSDGRATALVDFD